MRGSATSGILVGVLLLGLAMGLAVTALLLTWRYHRHTRSYIGVLRAPAAGSP